MSFFLDRELVKEAMRIARPTIEGLLGSHFTGSERCTLHLVVLNPGTDEILFEESFGNKETWEHPYDEIARAKARICRRADMVGRSVKTDAPWLLEYGDTRFVGGVVENGLVIAASGLQDYFDEMISWMLLSAIQALCRQAIVNIPDDAPDFLVG